MSEEKTKKTSQSKITPIPISIDEFDDLEMDQFLRESIMKEADELEARLNSDPALSGIGASDDMFDMIVRKLKAEGIWEENESEGKETCAVCGKTTQEDSQETICAETGLGDRPIELSETDSHRYEKKNTVAAQEMLGQKTDAGKEKSEKTEPGNTESEVKAGKIENAPESSKTENTPELSRLYEIQPEEALRLMELGKKAEQENERRVRRRVRRNRFVKRASVVAAMLVLVIGVGFSTEASRGWILKMWDAAMEGFGFKAETDKMGDGVVSRISSNEEQEAIEVIKTNLGVDIPYLDYLPDGMKFLNYEIIETGRNAKIFYSYQERIFSIEVENLDKEGVSYYTLNDDAVLKCIIQTTQRIETKIWETNLETGHETYMAVLEYENSRYLLNGMIPLEEMKKIAEFIIFL